MASESDYRVIPERCTPTSGGSMTEWPLLAKLARWEAQLGNSARRRGRLASGAYEFLRFGIKQGWACLFGGLLLSLIVATRLWYPTGCPLPRYDALFIASLVIQGALLLFGLETIHEARVILAFHLVGTTMELFKTSVGSWHYPEFSYLRIGPVPLFTGFMYAAVGSYLFRVWRLFRFQFKRHPPLSALMALSVAIYANFFADHWGVDLRWILLAVTVLLFSRTIIYFTVWQAQRHMPLLLGFSLVALFIWFGENIGTAGKVWLYPSQAKAWVMVSPAKLTSWFLLMLISYTMVAVATRWHSPDNSWSSEPKNNQGQTIRQLRRVTTRLIPAAVIAVCGLIWRLAPLGMPSFWLNYGGSALWGAMVSLIVGALRRDTKRPWTTPAVAGTIALAAELFRLYHAPSLDVFRLTLPGALLLGRVFNPWNIVAYWTGIAAATLLHLALRLRMSSTENGLPSYQIPRK
jgi:uncharacterized membrane protein YoaT (DUF817 family)